MGVWHRIKSWFGGSSQRKQLTGQVHSTAGKRLLEAIGFSSPPDRRDGQKLDAFHGTPSIFLVQHRVADDFASVEWTITRDGEPVDADHPARKLWDHPNQRHPGYTYRYLQDVYRDQLGESFAEIVESDDDGRSFELRPLPPHRLTLQKRNGSLVGEYETEDGRRIIPFERLVWSTFMPDTDEPYGRGRGIADVISADVEIDEFASEYVRSFFHNDATPRGILSTDQSLDKDQRGRLEDQFAHEHRGASRSHRTAVLSGGDLSYERISDEFGHLDITELREFETDLIRKVYGVPPEIVGQTEDSNRAKARAAKDHMAEYTTLPRIRFHQQEWQNKILPLFDDGDQLALEPEDPRPANLEHRRELMAEHEGVFTVNEIREEAGFDPREGGDVYLRPPQTKQREVDAGPTDPAKGVPVDEVPDLTDEAQPIDDDTVVRLHTRQTDPADMTAEEVSEAIQPTVAQEMTTSAYEEEATAAAERAADEIGVTVAWDLVQPKVKELVDDYETNRIKQISEVTRERVSTVVREGFDEGLRGPQIAEAVRGTLVEGPDEALPDGFPFSSPADRAETIARTEMGIASNRSAHFVHQTSGVVERQEWVAELDSRVRDEHRRLDGTIVGIDEDFEVAGRSAPHPHAFGVAELDINCRCTVVPKIPDRSLTLNREAYWKRFEAARRKAERRFKIVWEETFRRYWAEAVQPALEEALTEVEVPA